MLAATATSRRVAQALAGGVHDFAEQVLSRRLWRRRASASEKKEAPVVSGAGPGCLTRPDAISRSAHARKDRGPDQLRNVTIRPQFHRAREAASSARRADAVLCNASAEEGSPAREGFGPRVGDSPIRDACRVDAHAHGIREAARASERAHAGDQRLIGRAAAGRRDLQVLASGRS